MSVPKSMPRSMNVRLGDSLSAFVASKVGGSGDYDNVSEYVRHLVRKDKTEEEAAAFERLKMELKRAFAEPERMFSKTTADDVVARNRARHVKE